MVVRRGLRRGTAARTASANAVPPSGIPKGSRIRFSALAAAEVVAINFDVPPEAPLMAMESGLRLQVGIILTSVIAVATLQLRFTVPAKPFVPTTVMTPTFPVVAPGVTEISAVVPDPDVKAGAPEIDRAMVVDAVKVADDAVMVTETEPEVTAAEGSAVKVNT